MKYSLFAISILVLLSYFGCKEKELPVDIIGDPVFSITGKAESNSIAIHAGDEGYYMRSFYEYDSEQSVFVFGGELSQPGCSDCDEKLVIHIRDFTTRQENESIEVDQAFAPGTYAFRDYKSEFVGYETRFKALIDPSESYTYHWDLGNGDSSDQEAFVFNYGNPVVSRYDVGLSIETQSGCKSEISQTISIPSEPCQPGFSNVSSLTSPRVSFYLKPSAIQPVTYKWDFGDGSPISTLPEPKHDFPSRGVFKVCLEVDDGVSCVSKFCKNVAAGDIVACPINFTATTTEVKEVDSTALSKITVVWTDKNGTVYRSDRLPQPIESGFEILSQSEYQKNESGDPTQKLGVAFSCDVWDDNGKKIHLDQITATLAFAYPM